MDLFLLPPDKSNPPKLTRHRVVTQSEATSPFELMANGLGLVLDQCSSVLR
jgi:hypothetical protein